MVPVVALMTIFVVPIDAAVMTLWRARMVLMSRAVVSVVMTVTSGVVAMVLRPIFVVPMAAMIALRRARVEPVTMRAVVPVLTAMMMILVVPVSAVTALRRT